MIEQFVAEMALGLERFGDAAYLIIAIVVFLETVVLVGQFVPGSIILLIAGFLCYMQVLDFPGVMLTTMISHYAGEWVNYFVGEKKGRSLFSPESKIFKPSILAAVEEKFQKVGAWLLISGQYLGILRPFISVAAGISHYPKMKFGFAMIPACVLWAILPLAIGYFGGASWQKAARDFKDISLIIIVAIPILFLSGWLIKQLLDFSGFLRPTLEKLNRRIRRNPRYITISQKNPRLFGFLERRISISRPWGLGATVGFFFAFLIFCCFLMILWDVQSKDLWYYFDVSLINLLVQVRNPVADRFFIIITHLGSAGVVTWIVLLTCLWCFFVRQHKSLFVILCSVVLTTVFGEILELIIRRNRPDSMLRLIPAGGFSFPSGHTTVAFALFGSLYFWLWNHPGILRVRAILAFILFTLGFLVAFSRLYLGVHYPSDVTAGLCLGLAGVVCSATIATNWRRLADVQRRADIPAIIIMTLLVGGAYGYSFIKTVSKDRITPTVTSVEVDADLTLDVLPRESRTIFGKKYVPLNIVISGDENRVVGELEKSGWKSVDPGDFFSRNLRNPVFPAFIDGQPALHTLEKMTSEGRTLVRIWDSGFQTAGKRHYVGSVVNQQRVMRLGRIATHHQDPDVDLALEQFAYMTKALTPVLDSNFIRRGLYEWERPFFTHGNVLFFDL